MNFAPASGRALKREWMLIAIFGVVVVLFGALVTYRSAGMQERHTDFEAYARAGWAVRTGRDIYDVADSRNLHYCYPPTFALAIAPLGDPPANESNSGYLPFWLSIAIWYAISITALMLAVHWLASAVESSSNRITPVGSRRWLWLRFAPVLVTLPAIGNSLSHGQVNLVILLCICAMIAAAIRGQAIRAGAWLAGAIAIKVIPAYLGLVALRRRDSRWVLGTIAGLLVLLVGVPALLMGPADAIRANIKFVQVMIQPALGSAENATRAQEMFDVLRTDNQSVQAMLHAWRYWGTPNAPREPETYARAIHWLIGAGLTVATLLAARGRTLRGNDLVIFTGALTVVMLFVSPMCHLHYYCWALPLVLGLLHHRWHDRADLTLSRRLLVVLAIHIAGGAFPLIFERYRNLGFAPLTTLPLWVEAIRVLRKGRIAKTYPLVTPSRRTAA
jgi:hypothetical protein